MSVIWKKVNSDVLNGIQKNLVKVAKKTQFMKKIYFFEFSQNNIKWTNIN
jgi:hypothetical protein